MTYSSISANCQSEVGSSSVDSTSESNTWSEGCQQPGEPTVNVCLAVEVSQCSQTLPEFPGVVADFQLTLIILQMQELAVLAQSAKMHV